MTTPERPTVHLMCGLVGAGKTTVARGLAERIPALLLSRDEWMIRLHGFACDPRYAELLPSVTDFMWDVAFDVIRVGTNVVLDWNFWSRDRSADARERCRRAGASVRLHWLDVPLATALERASRRASQDASHAHRLDEASVRHFATIFEPPVTAEGLPVERHV